MTDCKISLYGDGKRKVDGTSEAYMDEGQKKGNETDVDVGLLKSLDELRKSKDDDWK